MLWQQSLLPLPWLLHLTKAFTPCPLLGTSFAAPSDLKHDGEFQRVLCNITNTLRAAATTAAGNSSSIAIGIFDGTDTLLSFQHTAASGALATNSVKNVTENTVFRIGSISKLLTIYLFILEAGDGYWHRPVTDFVPELSVAASRCPADADPIECVDWEHVTLGALASQLAGIARDYTPAVDLASLGLPLGLLGIPPLPPSFHSACNSTPCSRSEFLQGLTSEHPIFAPYTTPIYSNAAFEVLGFALESITGRSFQDMLQSDLFNPLDMNSSLYAKPSNSTKGVIPSDPKAGWVMDYGDAAPAAGMLSSQADMVKLGQSILNNRLLSSFATREWMKPLSFTSSLRTSVGMPWEIRRWPVAGPRVVDIYGKSGDVGDYHSYIGLIPEYNVGYVILVAGQAGHAIVNQLWQSTAAALLPALEEAARLQAQRNIAGTYRATSGVNSSLSLTTQAGLPGLKVTKLISNGVDVLTTTLPLLFPTWPSIDMRLYPTNLMQSSGNGTETRSYRAVFQNSAVTYASELQADFACNTWESIDTSIYGSIGDDEVWIRASERDGRAESVSPRVFNVTLARAS